VVRKRRTHLTGRGPEKIETQEPGSRPEKMGKRTHSNTSRKEMTGLAPPPLRQRMFKKAIIPK